MAEEDRFERYTDQARRVVVLAQEAARELKHNYIGTEHLLLGLRAEENGLAARVLSHFGVGLQAVQEQILRIVGQGQELVDGPVPFTPRAKKVLELSLREALSLGHNYIGTEHILLGLIRENEGVASRILLDFDAEEIRTCVITTLALTPSASRLRAAQASAAFEERILGLVFQVEELALATAAATADMDVVRKAVALLRQTRKLQREIQA